MGVVLSNLSRFWLFPCSFRCFILLLIFFRNCEQFRPHMLRFLKKCSAVNWWRNLNMWATLGRRRMGHFSSCWDLLQIFVLQSLYSTKWGWIKPKKDSAPIRLDWEVLLLKKFRCIAIMITQVNSECWLWSRNNVKCIKPTPANDRPITVCIN